MCIIRTKGVFKLYVYVFIHISLNIEKALKPIMGRIDIILNDKLEKEFREEVFRRLGMKKGNISQAVEEALIIWIDTQRRKRSETAKKAWETRKKS